MNEACLQRAMTYTHAACAGIQKDSTLTLRPKFTVVVLPGDVAGVRDGDAGGAGGGGGVTGAGDKKRAEEEESDFTASSPDFTASSSDEQVEDEEAEEYILFRPPARMSAGVGSSGKSGSANADILVSMTAGQRLLTTMSAGMSAGVGSSGKSASPKGSPAAATPSSATNAPMELQILVDRRTWKMQYEYEKLGEQEFRARAVLTKPEGGREELAWSPASGSKQKAKHAAAEIGLLACFTTQPPPNRSPAAAASATNAPTELQILVDRQKWKMQYEYERSGEQEFRARVLLIKSEGVEEELAWSRASGSKSKAKHAAAEIGLKRLSCLQS